ncbi:MAG: Bacterial antitoxin of ParD toxin-antitoxin type system [Geminicoccaceae bacterium]|jgi:putative addiction module CopG family antidote|nr:Bacterial antitoxin of ParD toxin-antitoxin type system [Geminicoccaceae bacterium]
MSVTLTPEHEAMIQERIASGRYRDAQEVIGDALRLLEEHERLQHLRALLEVARHDNDLVTYTPELMDKIYREAEEMFRRGEEPDPDVCP